VVLDNVLGLIRRAVGGLDSKSARIGAIGAVTALAAFFALATGGRPVGEGSLGACSSGLYIVILGSLDAQCWV
jgi:hypothetical protein